MKFTKKLPDKEGWWWFKEDGCRPEKLYIVGSGKFTACADDDDLAEQLKIKLNYKKAKQLGIERPLELTNISNWYGGTATKMMKGTWCKCPEE